MNPTQEAGANTRPSRRVGFYIDGYNVYYGLRQKGFRRFYWLDYRSLAETFLWPGQVLAHVKYFTSRASRPADSQKRQSTYLDALVARGGLEIVEGAHQLRPMRCPDCGHSWKRPTEKMTDVNIATHLVTDALRDLVDVVFLVCADADLIPAVRVLKEANKHVIVVSPRGRTSDQLVGEADAHMHFNTSTLGRCQLPDVVDAQVPLHRPSTWR